MFQCQPHTHRDQENTTSTRNRLGVEETEGTHSGEMATTRPGGGESLAEFRAVLALAGWGPRC